MKKLVILLIWCYSFCHAMYHTMPGAEQHPFWSDEEYKAAAKDCFGHVQNLHAVEAVKNFCEKKQIIWQEVLNPNITFYEYENKLISKEEKLAQEAGFFFVKWDNSALFIKGPLTDRGHDNTALLRLFFKDFTHQVLDLYFKARNQIIQKIDPNYLYKDEDDQLVQTLYPTKDDRLKAVLKEAIEVNEALLKYFDKS